MFLTTWEFIDDFILGDSNAYQLDPQGATILYARAQYGLGIRALQHFCQSARTGEVTYFDYGPVTNEELYGTAEAPPIQFENIEVPLALLWAEFDDIAERIDAEWFGDIVRDNVVFERIYQG